MTEISFLHLTDLHFREGRRDVWPGIEIEMFNDLRFVIEQAGGLDLVLFTGDLTQSGKKTEFEQVSAFLERLWKHFDTLGLRPQFLAVPGNHDMTRPDAVDPRVLNMTHLWENTAVHGQFWSAGDSTYRELVDQAFSNYSEWWNGLTSIKVDGAHNGCIPGDFSATFTKDKVKLGVLGLNSAFLQLKDGIQPEQLTLSIKQFHAACGGNGPAWLRHHNTCLLLTHHPADWLNPPGRNDLEGEIHYPPHAFAMHLFGHMHEHKMHSESIGGGTDRRRLQGAALFSEEPWGIPPQRTRLCGYSIGRLVFDPAGAKLEMWPRMSEKVGKAWRIQLNDRDFSIDKGKQSTTPATITLLGDPEGKIPGASRGIAALRSGGPLLSERYAALVGPSSFREIHNLLARWLVTMDLPSPIKVRNIALDMEMTWALIRDEIMSKGWKQPIEWHSLMADGTSEKLRSMKNATALISPKMAEAREIELREFCESKSDYIEGNNIRFACRAYADEPFMHGFLIDDQVLFMGLCTHDGTAWRNSPYLHFVKAPEEETNLHGDITSHFIDVFANWFDSRWNGETVRRIWPPAARGGAS